MDAAVRDTLFVGLLDREIAEAVIYEMRRRKLYGCLFFFPQIGGAGVFASATPAGGLSDMTSAEQLAVFSEVATHAQTDTLRNLTEDAGIDPRRLN